MSSFLTPLGTHFSRSAFICHSCQLRLLRQKRGLKQTAKSAKPSLLPSTAARTRFAPSPTGYLHLGSLRTALYNYLLAKKTGGQFLLRLEDTDSKRTVPDAEKRLYDDLRWAGLQWDEGPEVGGPHGPYRQSERTSLYHEHAHQLLESKSAYRCFCDPQRLAIQAEQATKLGLSGSYDRSCERISQAESEERAARGEAHVIRLRMPAKDPEFKDLVYGKYPNKQDGQRNARNDAGGFFEDPVVLKSDGLPTYHLANVVDDHHMQITHVIRGTEWLPSTTKHLVMYEAFGWIPPAFAHVGLLVDENGRKLSKRNMDTDIASYRGRHMVFPEALVNFVALLGWSHDRRSDVMDLQELVKAFTPKFTKGNTTVTMGKLHFLQAKHAALRVERAANGDSSGLDEMVSAVSDEVLRATDGVADADLPRNMREYLGKILQMGAKNFSNPTVFVKQNMHFFIPPYNDTTRKPDIDVPPQFVSTVNSLTTSIEVPSRVQWDADWIRSAMKRSIDDAIGGKAAEAMSEAEIRALTKQIYHAFRLAITGKQEGLAIAETMEILGAAETVRRLNLAIDKDERQASGGKTEGQLAAAAAAK